MRQLHFVGFTSDHDGLILAGRRGAKTGNFFIRVDDALVAQIEEARLAQQDAEPFSPALPPPPPRTRIESALSPREMQTRLRAGRTVAQVAAEAGVDIEWVERFAAPVLAEQANAIGRAQGSILRTQRRGQSDRPLASSIRRNLADRGILLLEEEFDSAWSAYQLADDDWIIRFRYRSRGRDQQAEYLLDTAAGTLVPNNRLATELGYVDPVRHAPPMRELPPMRRPAPTPLAPTALATKRVTPAKKAPANKPATPAKKSAPPKRAATTRKAATTTAAAARKKSSSPKKAATAKKTASRKTPAAKRSASARKATTAKRPVSRKTASAKKAPTGKKATPAKRAGTAKRAASPGRATPAKKGTSARKATPAKRPGASRKLSAQVPQVRTSPNGHRVRPLRAHRVETSGARNGSTHSVRASEVGAAR